MGFWRLRLVQVPFVRVREGNLQSAITDPEGIDHGPTLSLQSDRSSYVGFGGGFGFEGAVAAAGSFVGGAEGFVDDDGEVEFRDTLAASAAAAGVELNIGGGFFATSAFGLAPLLAFGADLESGAGALSSMTISPSEPGESGALRGAATADTVGRFSFASSSLGFLGLSEFFDIPSEEDRGT